MNQLKEQFDLYRRACWNSGNEPKIIWLHAVYMENKPEQIRNESEAHFLNFLRGNASPTNRLPSKERMKTAGFNFYTMGILESLANMKYEEITNGDVVWAGTPEEICEKVDKVIREVEGLSEIDFLTNYGGMDHWKVIKQQELLAKEVMVNF